MQHHGFATGFFDGGLLLRGKFVPVFGAHDEDVRNHGVAVVAVILADFAVAVVNQCGFVVFRAVNHALLQGGVEFAEGNRGGVGTEGFHHFYRRRAGLDADFHAFQIVRGFNRFTGVERAAACVVVGDTDEAFVFGGVQYFVTDVAGEHVVVVLFVFEDVGQVEDAVERLEGFEFGGVRFGKREAARLHEFNGFALGAKLGVRVDADFDFAIGVFLHFVSEVFHGFVYGDVFALVVGEFEGDGGLATGSEAKGKGGGKGFFREGHGFSPLCVNACGLCYVFLCFFVNILVDHSQKNG